MYPFSEIRLIKKNSYVIRLSNQNANLDNSNDKMYCKVHTEKKALLFITKENNNSNLDHDNLNFVLL